MGVDMWQQMENKWWWCGWKTRQGMGIDTQIQTRANEKCRKQDQIECWDIYISISICLLDNVIALIGKN